MGGVEPAVLDGGDGGAEEVGELAGVEGHLFLFRASETSEQRLSGDDAVAP
jgi:hypothetical protein